MRRCGLGAADQLSLPSPVVGLKTGPSVQGDIRSGFYAAIDRLGPDVPFSALPSILGKVCLQMWVAEFLCSETSIYGTR